MNESGIDEKTDIFGNLDNPNENQYGFFRFYFAGWVLPTKKVKKIEIMINNKNCSKYTICQTKRMDLITAFPHIQDAEKGGFEGVVTIGDNEGKYQLIVNIITDTNQKIEIGRKVIFNTKCIIKNPPSFLTIGVIGGCNLSCKMCPKHSPVSKIMLKTNRMDTQLIENIIPQLKDFSLNLKQIEFQDYGEPFLYTDIFSLVDRIANILPDCRLAITTNGCLLNEELIEKITQSKITSIAFSLDAATESTYQRIRVGGNLSKVIANIKILISRRELLKVKKPFIATNFVIMRSNIHELRDYINLSESLNVDYIGFVFPFGLFDSDKNETLKTINDEKNKYTRYYLKIKNELESSKVYKFKQYHLPNLIPNQCLVDCNHNGKCTLYIDLKGDAYPCCVIAAKGQENSSKTIAFGNINNNTLYEIWNSKDFILFREKFYRGEFPHEICMKCPKFYGL